MNPIEIDPNRKIDLDSRYSISPIESPLLIHFQILNAIVGGYNIMRDYANRIPAKGFVLSNRNSYCNQMLYFLYYQQTFRSNGNISIEYGGRSMYLRLTDNTREKLDELVSYSAGTPHDNAVQYNFGHTDFTQILADFINMLVHIDN